MYAKRNKQNQIQSEHAPKLSVWRVYEMNYEYHEAVLNQAPHCSDEMYILTPFRLW